MARFTPIDAGLSAAAAAADNAAFGRAGGGRGPGRAGQGAAPNAAAADEDYNFDQRDPFEAADFAGAAADAAVFAPAGDKEAQLAAAAHLLAGQHVAAHKSRGRGAALNPKGRFEKYGTEPVAEAEAAAAADDIGPAKYSTQVQAEKPRRIISRNDSADIPFEQSINPYRGCEHGCIYCYARPSHAYMGLSAGLDFESRLFAKPEAARLLRAELAHPGYKPKIIAMGSNTDPYQPIEKQYQITRSILQALYEARHPVSITTKSALILRDADILAAMAKERLVHICVSVETLDGSLARKMDPRASQPQKRLEAVAQLRALNVPVSVMMAPIIPALTDHEIESIAAAAAKAGALGFSYALLRLPFEVAPLFKDWLLREYPHKYRRVMGQLRLMRAGRESDPAPVRSGRESSPRGRESDPAPQKSGRESSPRGRESDPAPQKSGRESSLLGHESDPAPVRSGRESEPAPRPACPAAAGGGNNSIWRGERMRGSGMMAELLARRVAQAAERCGLNQSRIRLSRAAFHIPESWRAEQAAFLRAAAERAKAGRAAKAAAPAAPAARAQLSLF